MHMLLHFPKFIDREIFALKVVMIEEEDITVVLFLYSVNLFKLLRPVEEVNRILLVIQEAPREAVHSRQGIRPLHDLKAFLYKFLFNFVGILIFNPRQ